MPATVCSASQGWAAADSRPVQTRPSSAASSTAAPSSGCSTAPSPADLTSPAAAESGRRGQYRWCSNAYVGRSACCPAGSTAVQSTRTPRTCTSARLVSSRAAPPSARRSVPVTTGAAAWPACSRVSVIAAVSTGCGDTSMNVPCPDPASTRTARSNSTAPRTLSYQ